MNKELEKIIEDEFDCLIDDLGCLLESEFIKPENVVEAIKNAVTKAFVLGGVSQQRELLIAFANYYIDNDLENVIQPISKDVDDFLAINCG